MGETPEHAVIVHFNYTSTDLGLLYQLEDQLIRAVDDANAGHRRIPDRSFSATTHSRR